MGRSGQKRFAAAAGLLAVSLLCSVGTSPATAQSYVDPPRGSPERADILDALRPLAEWAFGSPVEFVVEDMRVAGDVAFAAVSAQRPGGAAIALDQSPIVLRDGEDPGLLDGPRLEALLRKSGRMWVPVQHSVGPTDVWYSFDGYCAVWKAVLPEYCPG